MTEIRFEHLPGSTDQDSTWSNPAKLSRKVRELTHRSYRAMKTGTPPNALVQVSPEHPAEDLRDLYTQVNRLQQKIHECRLEPLIPWVDGLRRLFEHRLGTLIPSGSSMKLQSRGGKGGAEFIDMFQDFAP
jgi:hypothetical protein